MDLWLIFGAMTIVALALATVPLWRRRAAALPSREHHLGVYRAQLQELERDRELGLLDDATAAAARLEIERRVLAVGGEGAARQPAARGGRWIVAALVLVGLPALSGGLYWNLGRPDQPAAPFAGRADERARAVAAEGGAPGVPPVAAMIAQLEQRLEADPGDLEGWFRLGRAHMMTENFEQAATAYRRAIELHPDVALLQAALGEALVMAQGGIVTAPARAAFDQALALDPAEPRARFYRGTDLLQRGEREQALEQWLRMVQDAPPGAPWLTEVRRRVAALAEELGHDPAALLPPPAEAPLAQAPPPALADRAELERLAARLEAEPKDWQGWIRLARGWAAAGDQERATEALDRGAAAYQGAPFVLQQLAAVGSELGLGDAQPGATPRGPSAEQMRAAQDMTPEEQQDMIRGMVDGLAARLEAEPDDPEGWRMLGRSWSVLGEPDRSAEAYRRLAELRPDDVDAQLEYAAALLARGGPGQPPTDAAIDQLEHVLSLDPDQPEALFHLGQAAADRGDPATAARRWQQLLDQLPADSPEHTEIRALLDRLDRLDRLDATN